MIFPVYILTSTLPEDTRGTYTNQGGGGGHGGGETCSIGNCREDSLDYGENNCGWDSGKTTGDSTGFDPNNNFMRGGFYDQDLRDNHLAAANHIIPLGDDSTGTHPRIDATMEAVNHAAEKWHFWGQVIEIVRVFL